MNALAQFVVRHARVVVLAWIGLAVALGVLAPPLDDVVTQDETAFLSEEAPSIRGAIAFVDLWPEDELFQSGALVFRRDAGLTSSDEAFIKENESWLGSDAAPDNVRLTQSVYSRPELAEILASADGKVQLMIIGFTTPPFQPETDAAVATIRRHVKEAAPTGMRVHLTAAAGVAADQAFAIEESIHRTTIITLFLVGAILLWVYRSPVAPLIPLLTIGAAFSVARGVIALVADAGLQVSALVETFMIVIVFGAGTDYCLFIVSRFKEDLARVRRRRIDHARTLVASMAIVGAVIASSAATVIVGFSSQSVAEFGLYRTTGPALAIAVVITLVAGLTLTPALLRILGSWAFWPWTAEKARAK
ncbi:MAG: MMPL family transporter [Actinomycetota bacterium]